MQYGLETITIPPHLIAELFMDHKSAAGKQSLAWHELASHQGSQLQVYELWLCVTACAWQACSDVPAGEESS